MYTCCIFCHRHLGRNQAVEAFPVGRRLAFDEAKGRLWVVCVACGRWNLTPLEERWEAIESCERLFRDTRLRVSTENVGLARLAEGTHLIRVGRPERPEFAAWRYGDRFGSRRRRHLAQAAIGVGGVAAILGGGWAFGIGVGGAWWGLFQMARASVHGKPDTVVARLRDRHGAAVDLLRKELGGVELVPVSDAGLPPESAWRIAFRKKGVRTLVEGGEAREAAAKLLPHVNRYGGSPARVREAVRFLQDLPAPSHASAAVTEILRRSSPGWMHSRYTLGNLQPTLRLALEMAAHEDAEREALEGELALLERSWREAEEIAAIADGLAVPEPVRRMLEKLSRAVGA